MARLSNIRASLRDAMAQLSTTDAFSEVSIYQEGDVSPPNFDEQKDSTVWVSALVQPTDKGEEYMGGAYQQMAELTFEIGSLRESADSRDDIVDALTERFTASRIGDMVVDCVESREEAEQTQVRQWYATVLTFSAWWDVGVG